MLLMMGLVVSAVAAEGAIASDGAVAAEAEVSPDTIVWIQPLAGMFGRVSVGAEHALGNRISVWVDADGVFASSTFAFPGIPDWEQRDTVAAGDVGLGVRFFPRAGAPLGLWLGLDARAGYARMRSNDLAYDSIVGTSSLQLGWSHAFSSGLAVHGALGGSAQYYRLLGDVTGRGFAVYPSMWLGVGYAF